MNKDDKIISDKLKKDLKVNQSYLDTIYATFDKLPEKKKTFPQFSKYKFSIATACCSLVLITGVAFAKDVELFIKKQFENFNMGKGVTTAIDNGYIGKSDNKLLEKNVQIIENNKVIDNINIKCKTEEFLMADSNLNIAFYLEFENKINDYVDLGKSINGNIDYEGSHIIELSDLFIVDENNNVLYYNSYDSNNFENYCRENNVKCDVKENIFTNASTIREYYYNDNTLGLDLVCNLSSSENYPNSQKLNIYFTKIKLIPEYPEKSESRQITLDGNWEIHLDVPKVMYNRENISYTAISCENDDFEIYEAKLTNTGFEIGLKIHNIEDPTYPNNLLKRQEELSKFYTFEEIHSR